MKVFNKWEVSGIKVHDPGLERYINLKPIMIPKTFGRNTSANFAKSKTSIVERFIGKVMVPGHRGKDHKLSSGHCTGKAIHAYKVVEKCFSIIEARTKKNPIEVFVRAIENTAPREEINTIEYGGARYPQAVECAPQRRVDLTMKLMVQGAYAKSFGSKKKIEDALADEIILAFNLDSKSNAISKKVEIERQADSNR